MQPDPGLRPAAAVLVVPHMNVHARVGLQVGRCPGVGEVAPQRVVRLVSFRMPLALTTGRTQVAFEQLSYATWCVAAQDVALAW